MSIFDVGRLCVKIAGRDAGRTCVVVEQLDNTLVLVDGDTRRRKVNIRHLEPLPDILNVTRGASHEEVAAEFKKIGLPVWETKPKLRAAKPVRTAKKSSKKKKDSSKAKN